MLRVDLDAAGIPVKDDCGRVVDFHSLRHTCGSRLARAGVSPQLCQRIMRHSTMELTLKFYTHLTLENKAEALQKLPAIAPAVALKTGTDNADIVDKKTDKSRGQNGGFLSQEVSIYDSCLSCNNAGETKTASPELTKTCGNDESWSGRGESNPRDQLGRLELYH